LSSDPSINCRSQERLQKLQNSTTGCCYLLQASRKSNKKSPANAKGNAQQQCMFEGPVRTKSKLTNPSNDVSFTLARRRDRSRAAKDVEYSFNY